MLVYNSIRGVGSLSQGFQAKKVEFDRLVLSPSALPLYRGRDLATVKLHFLPYFLHVLKDVEGWWVSFCHGSIRRLGECSGNTSYLGGFKTKGFFNMFTSRLGVWVTMGHPWPGKLMSFAKAKRENKKIEARQEKRDLEHKYKALEATCTSTAIGKHWLSRHVPTHWKVI